MKEEEKDIGFMGLRLRQIRKELGLSQAQAAQMSGLTEQIVLRLEKGLGLMPSLIALLNFYATQGYNANWVIEYDNTNTPMKKPPTIQDYEKKKSELRKFIDDM